jgi:predicted secreted Zn-dependent protease
MKYSFIPGFVFIFFSIAAQKTAGIEYSPTGPFNWSMFKGKVNTTHLDQWGNHTGAVTVSTLSYTTEVRNHQAKIKIVALFNPNESWTLYPHLEHPDEALNHEKRHFDICEIYARKFRQAVSHTQFPQRTFDKEIENIFKQLTTEYRAEQNRYDYETQHSINKEQQAKWNKSIDQQLVNLTQFKDPNLVLSLH